MSFAECFSSQILYKTTRVCTVKGLLSYYFLSTWSTPVKTLDLCLFLWITAILAATEERKTIISFNGTTFTDTR